MTEEKKQKKKKLKYGVDFVEVINLYDGKPIRIYKDGKYGYLVKHFYKGKE